MIILHKLFSDFRQWLWGKQPQSFMLRFLQNFLQVTTALIADIKEGQLSLRAMSLVYTTLLSLVPLLAISFSVLKGLGAHNQVRPFLYNMLESLGEKKEEIANRIIGFVDNIQVGVLGALGIVILLYTVIGMLQKIEHSFNYVWHVEKSRSLSKRLSDYLSVLLIGPILILLSSGMTTAVRGNLLSDTLGALPGYEYMLALTGFVVPYIILTLAFTFFYAFIPNKKVNLFAAFIGGLITALLWKLMGWGFSSFVAGSSSKTAIYSAFATIIVFMVWIYLVWLVLLVGASISFYIQYPLLRKTRHQHYQLSPALKEALALQIMVAVSRNFERGKVITNSDLSDTLQVSIQAIEHVALALKKHDLLRLEDHTSAWLLAKPSETITQYEILKAVRSNDDEQSTSVVHKELLAQQKLIDQSLSTSFKKQTLNDLKGANK